MTRLVLFLLLFELSNVEYVSKCQDLFGLISSCFFLFSPLEISAYSLYRRGEVGASLLQITN